MFSIVEVLCGPPMFGISRPAVRHHCLRETAPLFSKLFFRASCTSNNYGFTERSAFNMPKAKPGRDRTRYFPYAKGFHPPSDKQKLVAIGDHGSDPAFHPDAQFFENIPKCTSSDDWLAQYKEEGQTYANFQQQCPWLSKRKVKYMKQEFYPEGKTLTEKYPSGAIYVVPLGEFGNGASPDFSSLIEYAELFFQVPVKTLPAIGLKFEKQDIYLVEEEPENGTKRVHYEKLKSRYDVKTGHRQLSVDAALAKLRGMMPDDAICVIVLTMCDLYADRTDLFVAGMAQGRHRVAIFSLHRYDPNMTFSAEFWHNIVMTTEFKQEERQRLILQRSCRLLVHEISHLLGIDHCIYFSCCMNGSGHLSEDFRQPMYLCPVDLHKLQHLCGFDVAQRYAALAVFFRKYKLMEESDWMERRIDFLTKNKSSLSKSLATEATNGT